MATILYVTLLSLIFPVQSSTIHRFGTNLVLYSGYSADQKHISYTNLALDDWKNLTKLTQDAGLQSKALLCGVGDGAWLAYPKPNFQTDPGHNYAKILIGDVCISADNIESVQPVGLINKEFKGLLTFTAPFFGAEPKLFMNDKNKSTVAIAEGVASLISSAKYSDDWYVEGNGKKYCITRPKGLVTSAICILPDMEIELGTKDAKVTMGCEGADGTLTLSLDTIFIQMQTCFSHYGVYKIHANCKRKPDLRLPVITSICTDSANLDTKVGFQKIVDAWKFRMSPHRQKELNPANIDRRNRDDDTTPIRMEILNAFFEIFKEGCSKSNKGVDRSVPEWYFDLIRYLYMQHLRSVWEETPQVILGGKEGKDMWKVVHQYLTHCYQYRVQNPVSNETVVGRISYRKKSPFEEENSDWESDVLDRLLEGDELDHVIEQVWIMFNYVSPYCAGVSGARDSLWAEFVTFFRRQFFLPLLQQWLNPGIWQAYYEYMFNGVPIDIGKRLIISCVRDVLKESSSQTYPVDRPSALVKEFLNLSGKRPSVTPESRKPKRGRLGKSRIKRASPSSRKPKIASDFREQSKSRRPHRQHGHHSRGTKLH